MATKKKTRAARPPSVAAQSAQFQRQNDLRSLQEADAVRSDSSRLRGAKREAAAQRRALDRVSR